MSRKKNRADRDDDDDLDNASIMSTCSENSDAVFQANSMDSAAARQSAMVRMNEAIELLTEKRPDTRVKSLKTIIKCLQTYFIDVESEWGHREGFLSGVEFIMKKGRSTDQSLAVQALAICSLHVDHFTVTEWYQRFYPLLEPISRDVRSSCAFRGACSNTLALFHFLSDHHDFTTPCEVLQALENIFKGSCLKGDGKAPVFESPVVDLHVSCLNAWSLVFSSSSRRDVTNAAERVLPMLSSLLQASSVDVRISAGEVVALVYEKLRSEVDPRYKGPYYTQIVELLSTLSTDCTKARSKQDKKKQRHTFRDLLDSVCRFEVIESSVKFGSEILTMQGYTQHSIYNILSDILCGGISTHLRDNAMIRDLFSLGPPIVLDRAVDTRVMKDERRRGFTQASKIRTNRLNVLHDRRNNIVDESD